MFGIQMSVSVCVCVQRCTFCTLFLIEPRAHCFGARLAGRKACVPPVCPARGSTRPPRFLCASWCSEASLLTPRAISTALSLILVCLCGSLCWGIAASPAHDATLFFLFLSSNWLCFQTSSPTAWSPMPSSLLPLTFSLGERILRKFWWRFFFQY